MDFASVRNRLAGLEGRSYWRSLEELADSPEFNDYLHREFPVQASELNDPAGRRTFLKLMGASRGEVALKVLIPGCLRWVFSGMRIAVRYAFTAAVLGEVIASNRGVGYLVESYAGQFNSTGVFAAVLLLVVCSLGLSELLTRWESSTTGTRPGV